MRTLSTVSLVAAVAMTTVTFTGCGRDTEVAAPVSPVESAGTAQSDVPPEVAAELASLSENDRQLALKQRVCPVAGGLLGSMGTPEKLVVEGREVFICCEGCEEKLRSDPEKYFAKIDSQ